MKKFAGIIAGSILANDPSFALADDIVAARNIRVGAIVSASDIVAPSDRDSLRRAAKFIGLEAVKTFYEGQPLDEKSLRPPTLVKRNAIVQMDYVKGPMSISAEGRALDQGGLGDRIRIMNLSSKRVITAIVTGADSVKAKI
jgi:flagella basal body P-ring formation protein FlgA